MRIMTLALFVLYLSGCASPFIMEQRVESSTIITLYKTRADVRDATVLKETVLEVRGLVESGVWEDTDAIKSQLILKLRGKYNFVQEYYLGELAQRISDYLAEEIRRDAIPTKGRIIVLIKAATNGMIRAADVYIEGVK